MKNTTIQLSFVSLIVWLFSILTFTVVLFIATNGYQTVVQNTKFGNSGIFLNLTIASLIIGSLSFFIGIIFLVIHCLEKIKKKNFLHSFFIFIWIIALLPLYSFVHTIKTKKLLSKRNAICLLIVSLFLFPIWGIGYIALYSISVNIVNTSLGYRSVDQYILGTGSMYPTFPKSDKKTDKERHKEIVATAKLIPYPNGLFIFGKRYFNHELQREDIITFQNAKTEEVTKKQYGIVSGFIKRVIALPGDTLELRGGIVYLNYKPLKEPYTAKPQSTFAESYLSECKKITIPPNKIFAMGDNRKGSSDSREIGLVDFNDIKQVLTLKNQKGVWDKNWRDTSKDFEETSKIRIDKEKYLALLNEKRKEDSVNAIKYQSKLEDSAEKRANVILEYNDLSWEATRSGYTMQKAMFDSNYSNITYGEAPAQGYFEADELIENQFQFPKSKEFLLNKDYQEMGISEVEGEINGCPTQIIIQHYAGYIPPNYSEEVISSWEKTSARLREIQPSWSKFKENKYYYDKYKSDIDRINDIISLRISNIDAVVSKMRANQWFSAEQDKYTRTTDKNLYDEQEALATELNNSH